MQTPLPRIRPCSALGAVIVALGALGCGSPTRTLETHVDRVADLYATHVDHPATGLEEVHNYLQAHNPAIETASTTLRKQLKSATPPERRRALANELQAALSPRRERLLKARSRWQKAAVIDPTVGDRMRTLGAVPVQEAQTAFDTSLSALLRDVQRVLSGRLEGGEEKRRPPAKKSGALIY